jgi:dephospho-CoA kinase
MNQHNYDRKKRIIGLTGGIATGKSTVANYLAEKHQLSVLDADIFAREAVQSPSLILQNIIDRYGNKILLSDGELNRQELGNIIFFDHQEKEWIENQIHPFVRDRFLFHINKLPGKSSLPIVLVIPLLFEAKMTDLVTEIWVVYCDYEQQINRLIQRNNLTLAQADARIKSQMSLQEKCDRADIILDNSGDLQGIFSQVDLFLSQGNFDDKLRSFP